MICLSFLLDAFLTIFFVAAGESFRPLFNLSYLFGVLCIRDRGAAVIAAQQSCKRPLLTQRHTAMPLYKCLRGHLRIIPIHYINPFSYSV
nr:MAG TPA: hypothetical protein [Caudoviricetes sp.]